MKSFHPGRVGVDSYSLQPLRLSPPEILDWAARNGAEGVQFSGFEPGPWQDPDRGALEDLRDRAAAAGLYLEWGGAQHVPLDLTTGSPRDIDAVNRRAAEQAAVLGVRVIRSCSGGLMRWGDQLPTTEELLRLSAAALRRQRSMLRDKGVVLAIETHFEFTTFELLRLFDMCGAEPGGELGICLDTMNLLTMLEDPVAATRRVLPWVVSTHIKDGGILVDERGLVSFTAEPGAGVVDFAAIFEALTTLKPPVHLTLEDHGGDFVIPVYDRAFLARFPDLAVPELVSLLALAARTRSLVACGRLAGVERSRWPDVCEARVKRGLAYLRTIAGLASG